MPKTKFSKDTQEIYNLALDLARNDFSIHVDKDKVTRKDLEDNLRNKINNEMLEGLNFRRAVRRNQTLLFEIIEEIVDVTIAEDVFDSPFVDQFVEVKHRGLGDKTAFYSEGACRGSSEPL